MTVDGRRRKDTTEVAGDANGKLLRFCFVRADEVTRLDALALNLRSLNGEGAARIQRADALAVLLLSGLELVASKAQTLVVFPKFGKRLEFKLKLDQAERADRFWLSHWPRSERPAKGFAQGALVRLALQTAEADKVFACAHASRLLPAALPSTARSAEVVT